MEEKLNKMADSLTTIVMQRFFGERFDKCTDLEEDEEMNRDWEYLSEKIFGFLWAASDLKEEKETKALVFSIDAYDREELDKMSDEEKYDLACVAATVGYDEADVLTLTELEQKINDDRISFDSCWIYFVTV